MNPDRKTLGISDEILDEVNAMLDWRAAAPLPDGRILGKMHEKKRATINGIPDKRITILNNLVPLADRSVLEIGCFEGIHTMGLLHYTKNVTAIDVRPVNVLKTLTRLSLSGASAPVFIANCEKLDASFGRFDIVFHFGVLYHLMQPVEHIRALAEFTDTIYLDTHFATRERSTETVTIGGHTYDFALFNEHGWLDPFSGADPGSIHLSYDSLKRAVINAGFVNYRLINYRDERNGPRVLIFASKTRDVSQFPGAPDPEV